MHTLMLADGSKLDLVSQMAAYPRLLDGDSTNVVEINVINSTLEELKSVFKNEEKTSVMTCINEGKTSSTKFTGFQKLRSISYSADLSTVFNSDVYTVELKQTSDVKQFIKACTKSLDDAVGTITDFINETDHKIAEANISIGQAKDSTAELKESLETLETKVDDVKEVADKATGDIEEMTKVPNIMDMSVSEAREYKIAESKKLLAKYLEENPLMSSVHGGVMKPYTCTQEKQAQLTGLIGIASVQAAAKSAMEAASNKAALEKALDENNKSISEIKTEIAEVKDSIDVAVKKAVTEATSEEPVSLNSTLEVPEVPAENLNTPVVENEPAPVEEVTPFTLSWNATGEPCEYNWTFEELNQLAIEMLNYVKPKVSKQQEYEVQIKNMTDLKSIADLEIVY